LLRNKKARPGQMLCRAGLDDLQKNTGAGSVVGETAATEARAELDRNRHS
jgi:hypothetical protein